MREGVELFFGSRLSVIVGSFLGFFERVVGKSILRLIVVISERVVVFLVIKKHGGVVLLRILGMPAVGVEAWFFGSVITLKIGGLGI